jgi:hypothetical protein
MANNSNPLVPTAIVDKNGKQTTVHKKLLTGAGGNTTLPSPGASLNREKNIDWKNTSTEDAVEMAHAITPTLSDPTHIWDNFEFYTGMLNSHHHVEANAMLHKYNVLGKLRDAWLDMHGMTLMVDQEKYSKIKGNNGYGAFIKARDKMLEADRNPDPSENKSSSKRSSDDSNPVSWNPFAARRDRKEQKLTDSNHRWNIQVALDDVAPFRSGTDWAENIVSELNKSELLAKASELTDIVLQDNDNATTRNFANGLALDDSEHSTLNAMYAHKDYIAETPGHLGMLVETARYLKKKGLDYQQEDGTIPHLEGYVEAVVDALREDMLAKGVRQADNISMKPYLEHAVRTYNQQRANSV